MLSQNYDIAGYQNKDSRERREHEPFRIQISQKLHLQKCININPLMETIKKKHKSHTTTCHSPFADVQKQQSVNGDDEKTISLIRLSVILHLQMCRSSNPLMETIKKQSGVYSYISISPFVEVQKQQSINGDNEEKTIRHIRLHVHFSICRSVEVAIH